MSTLSLDTLRAMLPKGMTVYVNQKHVSRSGLLRRVTVHTVVNTAPDSAYPDKYELRDITRLVANVAGFKLDSGRRIILHGAGMDMHFHLVYSLSTKLHDDGYALSKESI